jgi:hypothetical protein
MAGKRLKSPYRKGYLRELEVMRILRGSGNFQVVSDPQPHIHLLT